jgi:hypothetical protein
MQGCCVAYAGMTNNNFKTVQLVSFLFVREETFIKVRLYGEHIQHLYGDDPGW